MKSLNHLQETLFNQNYYATNKYVPVELSTNAIKVMQDKYLQGETPENFFLRVATKIADAYKMKMHINEIVKLRTLFYNIMATKDFLPNSPTLMNAGRPLNQLAACFVVPIQDSMEGIFRKAIADMAMIQRTGGGTGFDFSSLRPKGAPVLSTQGEASGPVSFMNAFNACTETVKQGGARRGANMGILRIDHPDILEFIKLKQDINKLNNFNLSVAITDEFMQALKDNKMYELKYDRKICGELNAKEVWELICQCVWATGEPGIIFIDTINKANTIPELGYISATNPCGEQPLLPYEACNLGSINLASLLDENNLIDMDKLVVLTTIATVFLDCVIDAGDYPLPIISSITRANRKIGLGVMGFADLCFRLEIPYTSSIAIRLAENLMEKIRVTAWNTSYLLGSAFGSMLNAEYFLGFYDYMKEKHVVPTFWELSKPRNATTTTIAPTGTLALIADTSYGIEPYLALSYTKTLNDGTIISIINESVHTFLDKVNLPISIKKEIKEHILKYGTVQNMKIDFDDPQDILGLLKEIFITALDITPEQHIIMQAAFQKHTDNAVSKTINFKNDVKVEQIEAVFRQAYQLGCKGITVYRDGCRNDQPLKIVGENKIAEQLSFLKRPKILQGETQQITTGCGMMLVTLNLDKKGEIYEVLMRTGATGGCSAYTDAVARLLSISLRYGVPLEILIDQLISVRCDNFRYQTGKDPTLKGKSCPDVVGIYLSQYIKNQKFPKTDSLKQNCLQCGKLLKSIEGCLVCIQCGFSKC